MVGKADKRWGAALELNIQSVCWVRPRTSSKGAPPRFVVSKIDAPRLTHMLYHVARAGRGFGSVVTRQKGGSQHGDVRHSDPARCALATLLL